MNDDKWHPVPRPMVMQVMLKVPVGDLYNWKTVDEVQFDENGNLFAFRAKNGPIHRVDTFNKWGLLPWDNHQPNE